jgi:hypothetical protein
VQASRHQKMLTIEGRISPNTTHAYRLTEAD